MKKEWRFVQLTSYSRRSESSTRCCVSKVCFQSDKCSLLCKCKPAKVSVTSLPEDATILLCSMPGKDQRLKTWAGSYEFVLKDRSTKKKYRAVGDSNAIESDCGPERVSPAMVSIMTSLATYGSHLNETVWTCEREARNTCAYITQEDDKYTTFSFFPIFGTCRKVCGVAAIAQTGQSLSPQLCHGLLSDDRSLWKRWRGGNSNLKNNARLYTTFNQRTSSSATKGSRVDKDEEEEEDGDETPNADQDRRKERAAIMYDPNGNILMIHPHLFRWINPPKNSTHAIQQDPQMMDQLVRHITLAENACIVRAGDMRIEERSIAPDNTLAVNKDAEYLKDFFSSSVYSTVDTMTRINAESKQLLVRGGPNEYYKLDCISIYGERLNTLVGYGFTWSRIRDPKVVEAFTKRFFKGKLSLLDTQKWVLDQVPVSSHVSSSRDSSQRSRRSKSRSHRRVHRAGTTTTLV